MAAGSPEANTQEQTGAPEEKSRRFRIAFVCVGNACRSQMAEAWVRHLGAGKVEAVSAGISPLGFIPDETVQVMEEKNVSLEGQRSKAVEEIHWPSVDVLVNMSPLSPDVLAPEFAGIAVEWEVNDPFGRSLRVYRRVRDELERRVKKLLDQLRKQRGTAPGSTASPA